MKKGLIYTTYAMSALTLGWFTLRRIAHQIIKAKLLSYYEEFPEVGNFLVTADVQFITLNPQPMAVKLSIDNLLNEFIPIIGFNIPTEQNLILFLSDKLRAPTGIPKDKLIQIFELLFEYAKADTDEAFIEQKKKEVLSTIPILSGE